MINVRIGLVDSAKIVVTPDESDPERSHFSLITHAGQFPLATLPRHFQAWFHDLRQGIDPDQLSTGLESRDELRAYTLLEKLTAGRALQTWVTTDTGVPLVRVWPDIFASRPTWTGSDVDTTWHLHRSVVLHWNDGWEAEVPDTGVQATWQAQVMSMIADPDSCTLPADDIAVITRLLADNRLISDESTPADPTWEFHDWYFHHRTRPGMFDLTFGGTYRLEGDMPAPPVIKPPMSERRVSLVSGQTLSMPFTQVRRERRSIRHDHGPLTAEDVGVFLDHVARIQARLNTEHDEVSKRSYPGGGARYELEIYPFISDVQGIDPGVYHYDPDGHELEHLSDPTAASEAMLWFAGRVATRNTPPQMLLAISARFARVSWKYEAMAYALVLKNVGALYATMYDTATAMGLSPCALGAGNVEYFSAATGVEPREEPFVGEFILGGRQISATD